MKICPDSVFFVVVVVVCQSACLVVGCFAIADHLLVSESVTPAS